VPDAAGINYEQEVRPILANRCFGCHGPRQQQSGLRLDLRQNALRGGDDLRTDAVAREQENRSVQTP
jgi:mono/diheme cytochrome c family protein